MTNRGSKAHRSRLLVVGVVLAVIGSVLIAKPFDAEPLWAQWLVGFGLFYVGVPLVMLGAVIHFFGYAGPKDPFSSTAPRPEGRDQAA